MKLTLIAEGSTKQDRMLRRWGLSFLLGDDVLFDAFGRSDVFRENISRFHIDVSLIKHVVISHDHWDHTAGLWHLLEDRSDLTVYICPHFSRETKDRLAGFGCRIVESAEKVSVRGGVFATGEIEGAYDGRPLHEQSLVVMSDKGMSLIAGCAHPGIEKMVRRAIEQHGMPMTSVLGGFHLKDTSTEKVRETVEELLSLGVKKVAPMHCTGKEACDSFREYYRNNFIDLAEGQLLDL
jgi:7,8-dihydropterin-6-yl-methyl-4-(beta-D-ribofuranosyl)aminobenzene 5'-phosphate synthase